MPIYKADGKRDGLQKYKVKISYRDETGKHDLTRIAYGRSEALDLEYRLKKSIKKEPSHLTVGQLYNEYISVKTNEVRETTLDKVKTCFNCHILPYIGKVPIDKLTPARLEKDWRKAISEEPLAVTTKNNIYRDLRAFLNWLVKIDAIQASPLKKVDRFRDPYEIPREGKLQFYTPSQFNEFISNAERGTPLKEGLYIFFLIAYYTGARKGEINALKWSDIEGNTLNIRRSVNVKGREPRETPPKNKSSYRSLQLPIPLLTALQRHKDMQKQYPNFSEDWRICGGDSFLADTTIDKYNRDTANASNLPHIRVHDFRHSHASLLANSGINVQEIARRLGHSNVQETWNTYSHLYPKEEERALTILNSVPTSYRQNINN